MSANGMIIFGVTFEEGHEFPWDEHEGEGDIEGDIETWWRDIHGFADKYQPYANTETGYAEGFSHDDPRISEHYSARREWHEENPLPVEMENICGCDNSVYALKVPGVGLSCDWEGAVAINPALHLSVEDEQVAAFKLFLETYEIIYAGEPKWFLACYRG